MAKPMFDPEALISMFEGATAKQAAQLRKAVSDATLGALQGRELTLRNIRSALKTVSEAASTGAMKNASAGIDVTALLDSAVAGIDDAMLKAVEANRMALEQLASRGADLRAAQLQKALDDLDKFEDTMFTTLRKTAAGAGAPLAGAWNQVLEKFQAGGTQSGAQAAGTAEAMAEQMQSTMRSTRAAGMRAAQTMAESYTAMVSGVLLGMSEAIRSGAPSKKTPARDES